MRLCAHLALLASACALLASPAAAADRASFTINEHINVVTGETTFTASAPLCPSGSFADSVISATFNLPQLEGNVLIRTVYTCADGSGTITILKHVFLQFNPDFSSTNTGPVQILSGTGAYAGLHGHGIDNGQSDGQTSASGQITGWMQPS